MNLLLAFMGLATGLWILLDDESPSRRIIRDNREKERKIDLEIRRMLTRKLCKN